MHTTGTPSTTDTRAADVPLPPSMANLERVDPSFMLDQVEPAFIGISDEGDECIVRRFASAAEAEAYRAKLQADTAGNVDLVIMSSGVALAAPAMFDYCLRRLEKLKQLGGQHHKHTANRLAEKAELERILAGLVPPPEFGDQRADGVDATRSQGGAA